MLQGFEPQTFLFVCLFVLLFYSVFFFVWFYSFIFSYAQNFIMHSTKSKLPSWQQQKSTFVWENTLLLFWNVWKFLCSLKRCTWQKLWAICLKFFKEAFAKCQPCFFGYRSKREKNQVKKDLKGWVKFQTLLKAAYLFITPPRSSVGVIFSLQFVCACLSVCLSVCVSVRLCLWTKFKQNGCTDLDAVMANRRTSSNP